MHLQSICEYLVQMISELRKQACIYIQVFLFFPERERGELFKFSVWSLVNKILFGEFDDRVGFECH